MNDCSDENYLQNELKLKAFMMTHSAAGCLEPVPESDKATKVGEALLGEAQIAERAEEQRPHGRPAVEIAILVTKFRHVHKVHSVNTSQLCTGSNQIQQRENVSKKEHNRNEERRKREMERG
jgi:hypothetical protein